MILRIRWKFLALLVLFAQFFEQGVVLRHDCVRRGRSLWRVDGRWRHRDYVIGGWGDPVAILGMFGQVFLPVVLLAAITAGVAYCRVMCTYPNSSGCNLMFAGASIAIQRQPNWQISLSGSQEAWPIMECFTKWCVWYACTLNLSHK